MLLFLCLPKGDPVAHEIQIMILDWFFVNCIIAFIIVTGVEIRNLIKENKS